MTVKGSNFTFGLTVCENAFPPKGRREKRKRKGKSNLNMCTLITFKGLPFEKRKRNEEEEEEEKGNIQLPRGQVKGSELRDIRYTHTHTHTFRIECTYTGQMF